MKHIKYIVICLVTIFLSLTVVNAEVTVKERNESNNYGVNKDFKITDANLDNIKSTPYVDADELVYDFANLLSLDEVARLKSSASSFIKDTKFILVIYTLDENVDYDYNDVLGADFYDYNDFGIDLDEHYSGILLLRNANSSRPYFMMFAFGEAQFYYDSYRMDRILDAIDANIRAKNYYEAFNTFILASKKIYNQGKVSDADDYYLDENGNIRPVFNPPILILLIISVIITSIIVSVFISKNKMIVKVRHADYYMDGDEAEITLREDKLVSSNTTSYRVDNSSKGGGGFGGGSISGSSGGGHTSSGRRG